MIKFVQRAIKSWVMKVFLGLLVASFAVFGIGDVFTASLGSSVMSVGNQKIDAQTFLTQFENERRAASQRFGQPVDVALARQLGLEAQVISRLAAEATLDQQMEDMSISAPDEAVSNIVVNDPSFRGANGFDEDTYKYLIAQSGFTVEGYEASTRKALARNQFTAALMAGATAPNGAAEAIFAYNGEQRRFDFVVLNIAEHAEDPGQPTDADLTAFHSENEALFQAPELRDAVYIHLDLEEMAKGYGVDDAEVRALYDNRLAFYAQPERRALYQIILDDEAAADAAKARLDAGEIDFDALLAERDESRADTSLGEVVVGDVPDAVGEAAFASAAPGVVGPVDTGFGFALIDVAAITPAETVPFEDARAELTLDLQKEAALDDVSSLAGEIDDARAGGATLEEIAQDMGLTLGTARSVALGGDGDGLAGEDVFQAEVFDAEESDERDLVEMEDGSYFVARVDSIAPASTLPLADVRDQVVVAWRTRKYEEALDAYAAASLERVDEGELLAVIADESNVEMESEGLKTRSDVWISLPVALVQELFAEPMGGAGVGAAPGLPGAVVIAQVVGIEAATPDEAALSQVSVQLNNLAGADALEVFLQAKQREAGVDINGQLIESLLSQTGGHGY